MAGESRRADDDRREMDGVRRFCRFVSLSALVMHAGEDADGLERLAETHIYRIE